jgi:hypothetical protein
VVAAHAAVLFGVWQGGARDLAKPELRGAYASGRG